jgi:hypothetical protein
VTTGVTTTVQLTIGLTLLHAIVLAADRQADVSGQVPVALDGVR